MLIGIIVLLPILTQGKIELPPEQKKEEYFKLLLMDNKCRLIVVIRETEEYCEYYEEVVQLLIELNFPYVSLDAKSVGKFNGKRDGKFSYENIVDESRLYLVFVSNVSSVELMIPILLRIYFFRPRHKVVFIINNTKSVDLNDVKIVFKKYWMKEILNIVLVVRPYEAFIYTPYSNEFDTLINETGKALFPKRFKNMNKNVLRLSAFLAALDCTKTRKGVLIGRDVELWKTISEQINATFKHFLPRDGITYGLKFTNGTMTGVFRDIVENYTDFTLNSRMVKLQFEDLMEPTYPHDREDVSIIVPHASSVSEFVKFISLFNVPLWILVFVGAVIFWLLWWRLYQKKQPIKSVLDSYTLTLGNSIADPFNMKARFLLLIYVIHIFFIQAAYHSLLSSVLTVPISAKEIDTIAELDATNIPIFAAIRFKDMFQANIGGTLTKQFVNEIKTVPDDGDIEKLVKKHQHNAVVQKETFALLSTITKENYQEDGSPRYRMMKEKPMPTQVCYAARYGSPIIPTVNNFLRRFQEAGLDSHWKEMTVHRITLDEELGLLPAPVTLKVLSFQEVSIAFVTLAFGLAFAFFVLLFERCINHILV